MEFPNSIEVVDLSDPHVLRGFVERGRDAFIAELHTNEGSDVDDSDDEPEIIMRSSVPIHRQPFLNDFDDSDSDTANNGLNNEWRFGATAPRLLPFTGVSGMLVEMEDTTPMNFLNLVFTTEMIDAIVEETNRYAAEALAMLELAPLSRFRKWVPVTAMEMWAFFGLIIAMGIIKIDDLDDYWSVSFMFSLPMFRSVMKRDRFTLILSFLHVCNNSLQKGRDDPGFDPLFKIRNFVDSLNANFKRVFSPGQNIAIDEAMVAWRGPLAFRVYNPDKPDKFGIKVFELCDSKTGYCCNLEFYTGKLTPSPHGATFDVVDRLMTPYLGEGRTLYVDNYYTSHDLFTYLRNNQTLACGTLRLNRKYGPPKIMIPKLTKKKNPIPIALTNGILNLLRFFDKREVNILTTSHDAHQVLTGKQNPMTREPIVKLDAVNDYNSFMGAVDRSDQMVAYNAFKRRTLKWWKKAFFHMFMLGVLNSYIMHKVSDVTRKLTHRNFRKMLVEQLVQWTPIPQCIGATRYCDVGDSALFRLTARHFPRFIQPKPGNKKQNPQRCCVVCTEPGKRVQSRYECGACNVGLHVDTCFEIYHSKKDFKRALKRKREQALEAPPASKQSFSGLSPFQDFFCFSLYSLFLCLNLSNGPNGSPKPAPCIAGNSEGKGLLL